MATDNQFTATIGIECHVQFKTKTKLFSAVANDAREAKPNTLISHIDLGMPGALPVLNEKALEYGIRAAFALGTEPQAFSKFDRKHYFYPDLPMGYQITQFYNPIIVGGSVTFKVDGHEKTVHIHEAHLEADAGKSTHPVGKDYSLVDLNRAGTPLLEIVSEPEMHSAQEAKAYAHELYLLMRYADVSDANMYYGNMRFDVNVSVSKDPQQLGTRTETKNLNSFRSIEKAVDYEIGRQIKQLQAGKPIVQETRGWDDAKQKTFSQRSKEEAHDYRYMPEPDIPPIELTASFVEPIRQAMPTLPAEWRQKLAQAGVSADTTETLLEYPGLIHRLSQVIELGAENKQVKRIADWLVNVVLADVERSSNNLNLDALADDINDGVYNAQGLMRLSKLVDEDKLSSTNAKFILQTYGTDLIADKIDGYAEKHHLFQLSDTGAIEKIVDQVIATNQAAANDVKNGELKAIGFLVGQVMKASKGQANPQMAQDLIKKQLGI